MKPIFFSILFCLAGISKVAAQCNAINVDASSVTLNYVSTNGLYYHYTISITSFLANGNASIEPIFRCGVFGPERVPHTSILDGVDTSTTGNCFTWPTAGPSQTDVSSTFRCLATEDVFLKILGWSSKNCNGNNCVEYQLTNLGISLTKFTASTTSANKVCLDWVIDQPNSNNTFRIDYSMDGVNFEKNVALNYNEAFVSGNSFRACLNRKINYNFYRLIVLEPNGSVTLSPTRKIAAQSGVVIISDRKSGALKLLGLENHINPTVEILNMYGQTIYSGAVTSNRFSMPDLSNGIYVVRLQSDEGQIVKSIYY